eukprot:Nk52_evm15s372 gene=Nk52_evmTU15s372
MNGQQENLPEFEISTFLDVPVAESESNSSNNRSNSTASSTGVMEVTGANLSAAAYNSMANPLGENVFDSVLDCDNLLGVGLDGIGNFRSDVSIASTDCLSPDNSNAVDTLGVMNIHSPGSEFSGSSYDNDFAGDKLNSIDPLSVAGGLQMEGLVNSVGGLGEEEKKETGIRADLLDTGDNEVDSEEKKGTRKKVKAPRKKTAESKEEKGKQPAKPDSAEKTFLFFQNLDEDEKKSLEADGFVLPIEPPKTKEEDSRLKVWIRKIKNKQSASESRAKKRQKLESLEKTNTELQSEVASLKEEISKLKKENRSMAQGFRMLRKKLVQHPEAFQTFLMVVLSFGLLVPTDINNVYGPGGFGESTSPNVLDFESFDFPGVSASSSPFNFENDVNRSRLMSLVNSNENALEQSLNHNLYADEVEATGETSDSKGKAKEKSAISTESNEASDSLGIDPQFFMSEFLKNLMHSGSLNQLGSVEQGTSKGKMGI